MTLTASLIWLAIFGIAFVISVTILIKKAINKWRDKRND